MILKKYGKVPMKHFIIWENKDKVMFIEKEQSFMFRKANALRMFLIYLSVFFH